jgi:hypothetical protein
MEAWFILCGMMVTCASSMLKRYKLRSYWSYKIINFTAFTDVVSYIYSNVQQLPWATVLIDAQVLALILYWSSRGSDDSLSPTKQYTNSPLRTGLLRRIFRSTLRIGSGVVVVRLPVSMSRTHDLLDPPPKIRTSDVEICKAAMLLKSIVSVQATDHRPSFTKNC